MQPGEDELQLPREPAPMPDALRRAWADARDASHRAAAATPLPPDDVLASLADPSLDDHARLTIIDQLLGSAEGAMTVAHLAAARGAVTGEEEYLAPPRMATFAAAPVRAARRPGPLTGLKPLLLAASLMIVASTSWYVFSQPAPGDEVRDAGSEVDLVTVQPAPASAPITLRWKALRTDDRYSIEVLDAADAPVYVADTNVTLLVIPAARLKPGTYRWFVRARGTDGREIRSRVQSFIVR